MTTIHLHLRQADGSTRSLEAPIGKTLMRVATDAGIEGIVADCGGLMSCATCHVYVEAAWAARLPPPSADELSMLEMTAAERRPESRLACQIGLTPELDGLAVTIPDTQY